MANYETLKSAIQQVVKTNGNKEITGALLQQSLLAMINSLGTGYQFMGVATPKTNPGTPDAKVFYLAYQNGQYSKFGNISLENEISIITYDSAWHKISTGIAQEERINIISAGNYPITTGGYINSSGVVNANASYGYTQYLPVQPGSILNYIDTNPYEQTISAVHLYFYDKAKRRVKGRLMYKDNYVNELKQIEVPQYAYFVRVSVYIPNKSAFMVWNDLAPAIQENKELINDLLAHYPFSNYIDRTTLNPNHIINATGYEDSTVSDLYATKKIPLIPGNQYYHSGVYTGYYAFYDKDDNVIEAHGTDNSLKNPFVPPTNTAYGRFTITSGNENTCWIFTENRTPEIYGIGIPQEYLRNLVVGENSVNTNAIVNGAVTPPKMSIFVHDPETDFIPTDMEWVANKYVNQNGTLNNANGFYATDFIELSPNTQYYQPTFWYGYYAFYDANKELVEGHGNDGSLAKWFTTPSNIKYARFTCTSESAKNGAWIALKANKPSPYATIIDKQYLPSELGEKTYCEYIGNEISVFNKGLCVGDSLTQGVFNYNSPGVPDAFVGYSKYSYPTYLSKLTGVEITNMGRGGYTSIDWYQEYADSDLSGYDFAIIQLGVNDALKLGGWTQQSITAFSNIITKLKNENNNIKIFVATIMPALSYSGTAINAVSQGIRDLVESLDDDNVILLDMAIYAHTNDSKAYNCGHLSAFGYWRLAQDYANIISYYINTHKLEFRRVQFIGTNYDWN